ncbi:MAG TPA: hypothetical protein VGQ64_08390 [Candidatus Limnocylindrales bacterium]|nr:hypothetical protein [Candidatus Limnocylindrales bacterium]
MKKLVAACSLAFLLIVPVAVGADRVLSRDPEPGISLANAIAFRSEFGFDSDVATVTALLKAADSNYTYAAPLTAAEFENMQERERLIAQAEPLTTFVSNHPD